MGNGFLNRFQGKIKVAELWLGSSPTSGMYDAASGVRYGNGGAIRQAMTVTATANTDFTVSVPPGAAIKSLMVYTATAFLAATDAQIEIGSSAGSAAYVALTSIKAAGVVTLSPVASAAAAAALLSAPSASPNLFVRIVQTGTTSATGAATLVIAFDLA